MTALVFVEHDNAELKDATLAAVTAAKSFGDVHLLVAGSGCGSVAEAAAKIDGVSKVLVADDAVYEHPLAEELAAVVLSAERHAITAAVEESMNPVAIKYLNRLSDHLFVLTRHLNDKGASDVLWVPGANRA